MIKERNIQGSPEKLHKTKFGVFSDSHWFYFFESIEEADSFLSALDAGWNKDVHCAEVELAVDGAVNNVLKQFWYSSLGDVAATALNTKARWNSEAIAVNEWQARCYELLEDYKLSVTEQTAVSVSDFLSTLPQLEIV